MSYQDELNRATRSLPAKTKSLNTTPTKLFNKKTLLLDLAKPLLPSNKDSNLTCKTTKMLNLPLKLPSLLLKKD
jgi:hypothetical protein